MTLLISVSWFLASSWAQFLGAVTVHRSCLGCRSGSAIWNLTFNGIFDGGIPVVWNCKLVSLFTLKIYRSSIFVSEFSGPFHLETEKYFYLLEFTHYWESKTRLFENQKFKEVSVLFPYFDLSTTNLRKSSGLLLSFSAFSKHKYSIPEFHSFSIWEVCT
jgi:hypothetical protein